MEKNRLLMQLVPAEKPELTAARQIAGNADGVVRSATAYYKQLRKTMLPVVEALLAEQLDAETAKVVEALPEYGRLKELARQGRRVNIALLRAMFGPSSPDGFKLFLAFESEKEREAGPLFSGAKAARLLARAATCPVHPDTLRAFLKDNPDGCLGSVSAKQWESIK